MVVALQLLKDRPRLNSGKSKVCTKSSAVPGTAVIEAEWQLCTNQCITNILDTFHCIAVSAFFILCCFKKIAVRLREINVRDFLVLGHHIRA